MAKKEKLTPEYKSDTEWNRLYNAYLRQHSKKEMELAGNIDQTLTKVEFKGLYTSAANEGVRTNITRRIVQSEAKVSYKQARVRYNMYKEFMATIERKIDMGEDIPFYEYAAYRELLKSTISIKSIRQEPNIEDIFNTYINAYNKNYARLKKEGRIEQSGKINKVSYMEFITSP